MIGEKLSKLSAADGLHESGDERPQPLAILSETALHDQTLACLPCRRARATVASLAVREFC